MTARRRNQKAGMDQTQVRRKRTVARAISPHATSRSADRDGLLPGDLLNPYFVDPEDRSGASSEAKLTGQIPSLAPAEDSQKRWEKIVRRLWEERRLVRGS